MSARNGIGLKEAELCDQIVADFLAVLQQRAAIVLT
jgi:hypothetical protein